MLEHAPAHFRNGSRERVLASTHIRRRQKERKLTAARLREVIHYDGTTGIFTWRVNKCNSSLAGQQTGSQTRHGYVVMTIDGNSYRGHRLAWLYVKGQWPKDQVDHINGVRDDNRWSNLREASHLQNGGNRKIQRNNTSGFKGVRRCSLSTERTQRPWEAAIWFNGKRMYLGRFRTAEGAHAAYCAAAEKFHGEFARAA